MFENIEFANPKLLWLLLLVPLLVLWYILCHKKQEAAVSFSDLKGMAKLPKTWKAYLRHLLFALKMAALALLIVALARPQSSSTNSTSNIEGIDIVMAMDVSGSMLARDLKPDRLTAAKNVASDFVKGRPTTQSRFDVTAQVGTVFNPHTVLMVNLHHDAVVRTDVDVNKKILFAFKPFLYGFLHCTFANHVS